MVQFAPLTDIKRRVVGEVIGGLKAPAANDSMNAGLALCSEAAKFGLNMKDFLILSVLPEGDMDGYEMALAALNLPIRNDFKNGVVLQAASDTFQTYPGTRAMFPPVIDDILRWSVRQDTFENTASMVGHSRAMTGIELISVVVNDDTTDRNTFVIPELSNIPVQSIQTTETSVKMYKHGSGLRTSYEFQRRAALDVLTPYIARIARQLEISKVTAATNILINGDGINAAAAVVNQSTYNTPTGITATAGLIAWQNLLYWFVQRAQAMYPVDTVVGNWDAAFQWAMLFQRSTVNASGVTAAANIQEVGANVANLPIPFPKFAISSSAPAGKLIGFSKADTLEELIENGGQIAESERVIRSQQVIYTKTEVTGYRLVYGSTRQIYDYAA
jgi:hypothetical protein